MGKCKKESAFQSDLVKELTNLFPGCIITKTDPKYIQGIPDLLILFGNKWALLECKKSKKAKHQANQDFYVKLLNRMSFSSFIYPENKEDVINELTFYFQQASRTKRKTRSI